MDLGILILRVVVGLVLTAHGSQKLFGWFGGGGITGTTAMAQKLRMRPSRFWAAMVIAGEFGGGLLLAFGLFNPLGPLGIAAAMAVASLLVHWSKGFFAGKGGYEFPLTLLGGAVAVAFTGPGRYSLDAVLHTAIPRSAAVALTVLTVLAVLAGLGTRRAAAPAQTAPSAA
ncbi:MAG TPA: DoxX family protein [Candidatus Dormibacteraeota bacterium]|nr:DoxX family protein [Candidatus Dormibacteraeota bacterium]